MLRGWRVERQGRAKRMSGRGDGTTSRRGAPRRAERMSGGGDATTSQTKGTGGHGMMRGNGGMRGRDAGRSWVALIDEEDRWVSFGRVLSFERFFN